MGFIFPMLRECSFLLHCLSGLMETQSLHFAKIIFLFLLSSFSTLAWKHWRPPAESVHAWEAEVSAVYPVQWIPTPVGTTQYPVSVYPVGRTNPETSPGRAVLVAPPTPHLTPLWVIWRYFKSFFQLSLYHVLSCKSAEECGDKAIKQGSLPQAFLSRPWRPYCYLSSWGPWCTKWTLPLPLPVTEGKILPCHTAVFIHLIHFNIVLNIKKRSWMIAALL